MSSYIYDIIKFISFGITISVIHYVVIILFFINFKKKVENLEGRTYAAVNEIMLESPQRGKETLKFIKQNHHILTINNGIMDSISNKINNAVALSNSKNGMIENKLEATVSVDNDIYNILLSIDKKNNTFDDKIITIDDKVENLSSRLDVIDDRLDYIDSKISTMNTNLEAFLDILKMLNNAKKKTKTKY